MKETLSKLEWPLLLEQIANRARSEVGKMACHDIEPSLDRQEIEKSWREQESLRNLLESGYSPPLQDLPPVKAVVSYVKRSGVLDAGQLKHIGDFLFVVQNLAKFANDFQNRSIVLKRLKGTLDSMPQLSQAISHAVDQFGELRDDASPKLKKIRYDILNQHKQIESLITQLFQKELYVKYLQDFFFTIRFERYVLPMKLDGHGRINCKVIDTSHSDQTLFIEPVELTDLNDRLVSLEVEHKLEIMRILKDLSSKVEAEVDGIELNFEEVVRFDVQMAQAEFSKKLKATVPKLSSDPGLNLVSARHPLLSLRSEHPVVSNDIQLKDEQKLLIVSGPNAGGKTVVLKTVGLLQLMTRSGMLLPVSPDSEVFPFNNVFLELGDSQNLEADLSTFAGHLRGVNYAVENCGKEDLILLDELTVGTDNETGAALGQSILEFIADRGTTGVVTTHYANLKSLGLHDKRFRSGAMQYDKKNLRSNYKLQMDMPGESLGIELAEHLGLPKTIIQRAKQLKGKGSDVDQLISKMNESYQQVSERERILEDELNKARQLQGRWAHDVELLNKERSELKEKLASRFRKEFEDWKDDYHTLVDKTKKRISELEDRRTLQSEYKEIESHLSKANNTLKDLEKNSLAGYESVSKVEVGQKVYVVPLNAEGAVKKVARNQKSCEVAIGDLIVQVSLVDLRIKASK